MRSLAREAVLLAAFGVPVVVLSQEEPEASDPNENVALAFGLVTAAGLSTTIGAAFVFFDCFFKSTNHVLLGAALGFSAGVMFYVSLIEIFQKSLIDFTACDCLWDDGKGGESAAYVITSVCFFVGVLITYSLDYLVHCIFKTTGHHHSHGMVLHEHATDAGPTGSDHAQPMGDLEKHGAQQMKVIRSQSLNQTIPNQLDREPELHNLELDSLTLEDSVPMKAKSATPEEPISESADDTKDDGTDIEKEESKQKLRHMGLMTALAIGLHNFPEGLATFVATLADPNVGIALSVAIAVHNVPEGLCVAVPVFYATGSRWKGFWVAFWSGITELIGAALGYLFLQSVLGPATYASLFGVVSGMMVTIVMKELIPTAHRYDVQDKYVTKMVFLGAFVMALSLVLFQV